MCDPVTLLAAGTLTSAVSTMAGGIAQAGGMKYQAKLAEQNAALDRANAQDAMKRGAIEEQRQYTRNAQRLGAQRAALAANGVEVEFGSAADLQEDTRRIGQEDAATVRENAIREVRGFEIRSWNQRAEAAAQRANATNTLITSALDTGSTLLGGAEKWKNMKAKGY